MAQKIKVLIVDDSPLVRHALKTILSSDPMIEVMGTAIDPFHAATKIRQEIPDVITLDIQMPKMNGVTFLKIIMQQHPIPVVIISDLTANNSDFCAKMLEYGAIEIINKPNLSTEKLKAESKIQICDAVKAAYSTRLKTIPKVNHSEPKYLADVVLAPKPPNQIFKTKNKVIVVGASTGGTEALRALLQALPNNIPGLAIVQHMPEHFTNSFAKRLDGICKISVKEAENHDPITPGCALIAPGNKHILLNRNGCDFFIEVKEGPLVCRHRPSVDVLFRSAANHAGANAIGVIMTGMGDDGARGLLEMKNAGAFTIAQDEATSVIFGMPKEAIHRGGVEQVLPLKLIAKELIQICCTKKGK